MVSNSECVFPFFEDDKNFDYTNTESMTSDEAKNELIKWTAFEKKWQNLFFKNFAKQAIVCLKNQYQL